MNNTAITQVSFMVVVDLATRGFGCDCRVKFIKDDDRVIAAECCFDLLTSIKTSVS